MAAPSTASPARAEGADAARPLGERRVRVRAHFNETDIANVVEGLAATVTVDAFPGQQFPARVTEISPTAEFTPKAVETRAERVNLVYAAKVDLDAGWNAPLVPGQPAEVLVTPTPAGTPQ